MAHYLLRIDDEFQFAEADSAKQAIDITIPVSRLEALVHDEIYKVEVWTLRSGEPRVYKITAESVRTVRRVE